MFPTDYWGDSYYIPAYWSAEDTPVTVIPRNTYTLRAGWGRSVKIYMERV
jgi:hypothetical protein